METIENQKQSNNMKPITKPIPKKPKPNPKPKEKTLTELKKKSITSPIWL